MFTRQVMVENLEKSENVVKTYFESGSYQVTRKPLQDWSFTRNLMLKKLSKRDRNYKKTGIDLSFKFKLGNG